MRKSKSHILIISGILILIAAGGLFIHSRLDDRQAALRAQSVLEQVLSDGWEITIQAEPNTAYGGTSAAAYEYEDEEDNDDAHASGRYTAIGILEIPGLNITLPVFNSSKDALLEISVGMYMGSVDGKPDRLVIAGHNYRSHFGRISTIKQGDIIRFTTKDGVTYSYEMIGSVSVHMNDNDAIESCSLWDITLLTCQRDNTYRTLVRFREIT